MSDSSLKRKRSRPLHNFDLPQLKWGYQKLMPCIGTEPKNPELGSENFDDGIQAVKENVILDFKPECFGNAEAIRPWNLRARGPVKASEEVSVQLSKDEIEADYMRLFGRRPPRRPRRRPRSVRRELEVVFPGLGLTEITADKYKIRDVNGKG